MLRNINGFCKIVMFSFNFIESPKVSSMKGILKNNKIFFIAKYKNTNHKTFHCLAGFACSVFTWNLIVYKDNLDSSKLQKTWIKKSQNCLKKKL